MSELPGAAPATDHDEGSPRVLISGLNRTAFDLAVYASQGWSPTHHARLASGCWSGSTGRDWLPAGFHLKGFKLPTVLLSRASWRDISSLFVQAIGSSGKIIGVGGFNGFGWTANLFSNNNALSAAPSQVTINTTTALAVDLQFQWSVASASVSIQLLGGTIYLD